MKRFLLPLLFAITAVFCLAAGQSAQNPAKSATAGEDFWSEDWGPDKFPRISEDRINQILLQIRRDNPDRADELEKLRKDNLDEFRNQLRTEILKLYRQRPGGPGPGPEDRPGRGGPEGQISQPDRPPQQGSRPEPGSPERWHERWERRHLDFIAWLEKNYPDEAIALKQFQEKQPDKYIDRVTDKMRIYDPIRDIERKNPELAKVMKEDLELQKLRDILLKQLQSANEKDKEKLMADLKENVSRRFDIIMIRKQLQYEELKKRLEDLQKDVCKQEKQLEQLKTDKDKLVKDHFDDLLQKAQKMNWN